MSVSVFIEWSHPRQSLTKRAAGNPLPPCPHHTSVKTDILSPTSPRTGQVIEREQKLKSEEGLFVIILTVNILGSGQL